MRKLLSYLLLALLPFLTGCVTTSSDAALKQSVGSGVLKVSITDVPMQNIQRLNVKITELSVKRVLTNEAEEWILLKSDVPMFNIMDYRNGILYMLGNKQMEPGHYTQFRLKFAQAELVENSVIHDMTVSQDIKDGYLLNYDFTVTDTADNDVVIDLNVEKSVTLNGDNYIFNPSLRITEKSKSGSISGKVYPVDSNAKVEVYNNDGEKIGATIVRSDGSFVLSYLEPGSYDLMAIAPGYEINTKQKNIIVKAGIITPGLRIDLASE